MKLKREKLLPDISAHSGEVKLYLPSIMFLNITICRRCQNGGQPTNKVYIITPQAHLNQVKYRELLNGNFLYKTVPLTYRLLLSIQWHPQTCYTVAFQVPNNRVFHIILQS